MRKYGPWEVAFHCSKCKKEVEEEARLYNGGVCPMCGNSSAGTLVQCDKLVRRKVYKPVKTERREAIEATRAKKNFFSFLQYRVVNFFKKMRPRVITIELEYRDGK